MTVSAYTGFLFFVLFFVLKIVPIPKKIGMETIYLFPYIFS